MPSELSLPSLMIFASSRWRTAAKITGAFLVLGLFAYLTVDPYAISSTVQINDAATSQLQAFTNNFFALSKTQTTTSRKSQTPSQSASDYLDRQDTYTSFVKFLAQDRA